MQKECMYKNTENIHMHKDTHTYLSKERERVIQIHVHIPGSAALEKTDISAECYP